MGGGCQVGMFEVGAFFRCFPRENDCYCGCFRVICEGGEKRVLFGRGHELGESGGEYD